MTIIEKLDALLAETTVEPTHVWAVPGKNSIIDQIHPITGLTYIYGKDEAAVHAEDPDAVRMTWEEWQSAAIARQRTPFTWREVRYRTYVEMCEVLPPIDFDSHGFLVGEPWDHDFGTGQPRYAAYRAMGGRFYTASRPLTRTEFRQAMRS